MDGARYSATRSNNVEEQNGLFAITPKQLGTLHNPKNLTAFLHLGSIDELVNGLRSDRTEGLGGPGNQAINSPTTPGIKTRTPTEPASSYTFGSGMSRAVTQTTKQGTGLDDDPYGTALFAQRKAVFLNNSLPTKRQPSFLYRVWMAYNDPVLFLLTAAAAVSLVIGLYQTFTVVHTVAEPPVEWVEGVAILVAVVIITLAGSINDWEKARQFKKLNKKQLEWDAKVIRGGVSKLIPSADILVGDVVLLDPGDVIPADGILLTGHNVMCDESSATGESELVHKMPGDAVFLALKDFRGDRAESTLPVHDPFVLSGTKVLEGVGTFIVTATGRNSTYGRILSQLREEDDNEPTPLQARLAVLAKYIAWIGTAVAVLFFLALFIRFLVHLPHDQRTAAEKGKNFIDIVIIALTVLVIAVPEGLPLAVTLSLAFATTRMLQDHNLVRRLKACETMSNATSVCCDKTGTLTQNKMTVVAGTVGVDHNFSEKSNSSTVSLTASEFVRGLNPNTVELLRQSIALNSTAFESEDHTSFVGSNTESALLNFAKDYLEMRSVSKERAAENITQLVPFSGVRKYMATVIRLRDTPGTYRVLVKGAAEDLLAKSTRVVQEAPSKGSCSDIELSPKAKELLAKTTKTYAGQPLRVVGLFYRDLHLPAGETVMPETDFSLDYLLKDLVILGLMGIHDPLRPGVGQSVRDCQRAGVTVRMVTGDNLLTAKAIAKECGILSGDDICLEGATFRTMNDGEKRKVVPHLKVLARSTPEDKQKLVVFLKDMGEIVAVTGDGTNDASAMSAADVSFAMGLTGTEVARQASSIILTTDDFTSIVKAIMWGRAVNDSVKKFLQFQITITVTSVLLAFVSGIADSDEQSVLTPVQLMWINLFQDTLAALALATDPPQPRLLCRKPEPRMAPLITIQMWKTIVGQSIYQTAVTLVLYFAAPRIFAYQTDTEIQQIDTLVFNTYVWLQIFNMYNSRQYDDTLNILEGVQHNRLFLSISSLMIGLQILIIFVGGPAFTATPLTGSQWAVSLVLGVLTLVVGALLRLIPTGRLESAAAALHNLAIFRKRREARGNSLPLAER